MQSVLELARYRVGDIAWWITLRPLHPTPELTDDEKWMEKHHPKALYERGPYKDLWDCKARLPKLQHLDFHGIVGLLTTKLIVEKFPVCDIIRSRNTGEFFYANDNDEWIPEEYLLDTKVAADREKTRVLRLIKRWADDC